MIYVLILNKEMPVKSLKREERQKEIPRIEMVVPAEMVGENEVFLEDFLLYVDGTLVISGFIAEPKKIVLADGDPDFYRLIGKGELGRLWVEEAYPYHFQNVVMSTVINTLVSSARQSSWVLVSTGVDNLIDDELTVDVRGRKETLYAQIEESLKRAQEPTYLRYQGLSGSNRTVSIGNFGNHDDTFGLETGGTILSAKFQQNQRLPIAEARVIVGRSSEESVPLALVLTVDPDLAIDDEYPVVAHPTISGEYVIRNDTLTGNGVYRTLHLPSVKTKNDVGASPGEKQEVIYAGYKAARRIMKQSNPYTVIEATMLIPLAYEPQINDMLYVGLVRVHGFEDVVTGRLDNTTIVDLRQWMRVVGLKAEYETPFVHECPYTYQEVILWQYTVEVTSVDDIDTYDPSEKIYEALEPFEENDNPNAVTIISYEDVTVNESGVASNCAVSGTDGRQFEFALPAVPGGASVVTTVIQSISKVGVQTSTVQVAALPATNLILCVTDEADSDWTVASDISVTVRFYFS